MLSIKKISIALILLAIALLGSYHIYYSFNNIEKEEKVINYLVKDSKPRLIKTVEEKHEEYLGVLIIDKINLKEGFYSFDSENNDVNKNIMLLEESKMPDIKGSTLFLAAHSGNSYLGYFKNLKKIQIGDIFLIKYQGKEYRYAVNKIYLLNKNGEISVNKNSWENYLVLTTCHDKQQLVITSKLLNNT